MDLSKAATTHNVSLDKTQWLGTLSPVGILLFLFSIEKVAMNSNYSVLFRAVYMLLFFLHLGFAVYSAKSKRPRVHGIISLGILAVLVLTCFTLTGETLSATLAFVPIIPIIAVGLFGIRTSVVFTLLMILACLQIKENFPPPNPLIFSNPVWVGLMNLVSIWVIWKLAQNNSAKRQKANNSYHDLESLVMKNHEASKAAELVRAKKAMVAALRHEVNNPLTIALGSCRLLLESEKQITSLANEKELLTEIEQALDKAAASLRKISNEEIQEII